MARVFILGPFFCQELFCVLFCFFVVCVASEFTQSPCLFSLFAPRAGSWTVNYTKNLYLWLACIFWRPSGMVDRQNEWSLYAIFIRSGGHESWFAAHKAAYHDWFAFCGGHQEWLTARKNETCMRCSFVLAVMHIDLQHKKTGIDDWFEVFGGHLE